jgi:hypothetical protein
MRLMKSRNGRDGVLAATSLGTANSDGDQDTKQLLHRSNDARTRLLDAAGAAGKIELANMFGVQPALSRRAWCGSYLSARRTLDGSYVDRSHRIASFDCRLVEDEA